MTNSRIRSWTLCVAGTLAASLVSATWAKDELPKAVRQVLSAERQVRGTNWNRRQELGEEVVKAKNSAEEVRWHAGYVRVNGKWLPFEEAITPEPMTGNGREYLDRREKAEQNPNSQAGLATWCSSRGMLEQSQAHNHRAIMLSPSNQDVSEFYRRMRYVRAGSNWLSQFEIQEAKHEIRRYADQLDQWTTACQRLAGDLESGQLSEVQRQERLHGFASDERIPAIEVVLAYRSESSALAAIEAIGQVPTYRASQALSRLAVLSPWLFARDRAIAGLKTRKPEEFIPQWLSLARTPVRTECQWFSNGRDLGFFFLAAEEHESEIRVAKTAILAPGAGAPQRRSRITGAPQFGPRRMAYLQQLSKLLGNIDESMKLGADLTNDESSFINERLAVAFQGVIGASSGDTPTAWWNWWSGHCGFEPVSDQQKRVVIVGEENRILPPAPRTSCLVAGTPIRTDRGLVAVERLQPGDRVLSKNIETGELAYKVVLHTTVREPFAVTKFSVGDETIQATEGHHFWVSGRGWTKTRELAAEQPLHTPIGVVRVDSKESAESQPTYNLVVADFHTYFVGKNAILSHDVLPPKPTNKLVPGLGDE